MDNAIRKRFEELVRDNKEWVFWSRRVKKFDGIKRLLTELYPDAAHFIYELLQNAQDASKSNKEPTHVRFFLDDKKLVFEHSGEKLFDINDVEAILSIGEGTKRGDATSIGKFGAGFKSVFAYTSTPQIHSGEFHFEISDLTVPKETVNVSVGNKTRFVLPFDNPDKAPSIASSEIERELRGLGSETLLFLSNIYKITYMLPDGKTFGFMERENEVDGITKISVHLPNGEPAIKHWLKYDKSITVMAESGESVSCQISIAFYIIPASEKDANAKWKIEPLKPRPGNVSIYFPAVKENSGLHFLINAPFPSTVARDSIRECMDSDTLRDELAKFFVEILSDLMARGLLTIDFLAVLPTQQDGLDEFYEPIRKAIVDVFNSEPYVPTKNGTYAPAKVLYRSSAKIMELFDDTSLSLLTGKPTALWAKTASQRYSSREDQFLNSLSIKRWGHDELVHIFGPHNDKNLVIEKIIHSKPDAWLSKFYTLLNDEDININGDLKIVRTIRDIHTQARNTYFTLANNAAVLRQGRGALLVKPETYEMADKGNIRNSAKNFLESIGVRHFDEHVAVEKCLSLYNEPNVRVTIEDHIADIMLFMHYLANNPHKLPLIKQNCRFRATPPSGVVSWIAAHDIFIDKPFEETGLEELRNIHRKSELWSGYFRYLPREQLFSFITFVVSLGGMRALAISSASAFDNPNRENLISHAKRTRYEKDEDYTIEKLANYIKLHSATAARLIWTAVISERRAVARACYRPNGEAALKTADSQLICILRDSNWIPAADGKFYAPAAMSEAMLLPEFAYDDGNGLLSAIGFGMKAKEKEGAAQESRKRIMRLAKELGLRPEDIEAMKDAEERGINIAQVLKEAVIQKAESRRALFPENNSPNPERREQNIKKEYSSAQEIRYEKSERSVRVSSSSNDTREYLRNEYTNDVGEMICQICKNVMPFIRRNGEYYFEAVSAFNTPAMKKIRNESEINHIALCPICAAKYKEFVINDSSAMKELIARFSNEGLPEVKILLDQNSSIRFTEKHWRDLTAILSVESKDSAHIQLKASTVPLTPAYKPARNFSEIKEGACVFHSTLGSGIIKEIKDGIALIRFREKTCRFRFPSAFADGYLQMRTLSPQLCK